MSVLSVDAMEPLNWKLFKGLQVFRVGTMKDGSCYFHAIVSCILKDFRNRSIAGRPISRTDVIKQLRKDLSNKLPLVYNTLSRGGLQSLSLEYDRYRLENLRKELEFSHEVDHIFHEYISNELNLDIYILDWVNKDVYCLGDEQDLYRKRRNSIVILYYPGHYEYVGLKVNDMKTGEYINRFSFSPSNEFIDIIREREAELCHRS